MTAVARNRVAPAGGDRECRVLTVQTEGSNARDRVGGRRIVRKVIEGKAGACLGRECACPAVLVVEEHAGAETETVAAPRIEVEGGAGGGKIQIGVDVEAIGRDVVLIDLENVAGGAQIHVLVEVG